MTTWQRIAHDASVRTGHGGQQHQPDSHNQHQPHGIYPPALAITARAMTIPRSATNMTNTPLRKPRTYEREIGGSLRFITFAPCLEIDLKKNSNRESSAN
jgi:hypothetical protein